MSQAPTTPTERLIAAPVAAIAPSGTNPRTINQKDAAFLELVASIKAAGVVIPVHVRTNPRAAEGRTPVLYELLAGERRWRAAQAAGVETIPAIDHGPLDDAAAFEITFVENYRRKDLTPMEAGKGVAILLGRLKGDGKAAAAKLGQTERWVQLHAQIERGLSADWKAAAQTERLRGWSAAHWVLIARLPAVFQAKALKSLAGNAGWDCPRWSTNQLEAHLVNERLLLAKAPFATAGCAECLKRTGVQPLLWGDEPAELEGVNDRCLDRACWQRKEAKAAKAVFAKTAADRGVPEAIPVSMVQCNPQWPGDPAYREKIAPARKAFGKGLVPAERLTVCKKDAPGAVPAIVVAGRGKGALKYVRVAEATAEDHGPRPPTARERAAAEREERKKAVVQETFRAIARADCPSVARVLFCCYVQNAWPYQYAYARNVQTLAKAAAALADGDARFLDYLAAEAWRVFVRLLRREIPYIRQADWAVALTLAPLFGLDANQRLAELHRAAKADAAKDKAPRPKGKRKESKP